MVTTLFNIFLVGVLFSDPPPKPTETPRRPHPLAPSLRELTEEEENRIDEIIDRFILYDTGRLPGPEGKQALREFEKLGPDAIPALVRGLNRAAKIEHSCPAVTIAKKLGRMLRSSKDPELLEFVRENAGAGITHSRHMGVIKDLRVICMVRKRAVANTADLADRTAPTLRGDSTSPSVKENDLRNMDMTELVEAAGKERGPRLKMVLTELGRRCGDQAIGALGSAAATYDGEIQSLARDLLTRQLSDLNTSALKRKLVDDHAEVRAAAARVASKKGVHCESVLISLLTDDEAVVRESAHDALVHLNPNTDFGPKSSAGEAEVKEAARKWRLWLDKQSGR